MTAAYDLIVTAVSERADLFVQAVGSILDAVDQPPSRIVVHEDVRAGSLPGVIAAWLARSGIPYAHRVTDPARGLGPAMVWAFGQAETPIVLYTQEDWRAVRPLPIAAALRLMERERLNHIRFNKRKTMAAKHADTDHPWRKVAVELGGRVLCISDHWYTQTSLWRAAVALPGLRHAAGIAQDANPFVSQFNHWMNLARGDSRPWDDQQMRHERLRTYIWGPVGEPRFIEHLGTYRTTGPINHVIKQRMKEGNPE